MPRKPSSPWTIEGRDSWEKLLELTAPGNLTDHEVTAILQRFASQRLSPEELVGASLRRSHRGHTDLLASRTDTSGNRYSITVGVNPWFVAWKPWPNQSPKSSKSGSRTSRPSSGK